MSWRPVLKTVTLLSGFLFLLGAAFCLAGQAWAEQDLPASSSQPEKSSQFVWPGLEDSQGQTKGQAEKRQTAARREQGSGFYLATRFLCQWQVHADKLNIMVNGVSASDSVFYSQPGVGFGLAAGYDLWPEYKWPLRADLELALRGNSHYSRQASHHGGRQSESFKSLYNATTLLLSFYYDYHNETSFVPYLTAGAGLAFVYADFDYQARVATEKFRASGSQTFTNFAWAVGSGIVWRFSEQLSIDLGYRYLDPGNIEFSGAGSFGPAKVSYRAEDLSQIHEISLGLRFAI